MSDTMSDMPGRSRHTNYLLLTGLFMAMTFASYISLENDLRITSALVYLIAIVTISVKTNLKYGLLSAVTSSVIYNFFLSEPLWKFGVDSYDDVMPLIAFNITAVFTGVLGGRLSERARDAEIAQTRVRALLRLSDKLQQAVTMEDIAKYLEQNDVDLGVGDIKMYDSRGAGFGEGAQLPVQLLSIFANSGTYLQHFGSSAYHVIKMADEPIGILCFHDYHERGRPGLIDLESLVNLIRLALERCMLLREQSEIDGIRRSEELKTAILSSISHDMRTPLAAISASATSLSSLQNSLTPTAREGLLQTIVIQCQRLDRFTANLLNIGRLQAGLGEFEREPVDLLDILGAVLSSTRSRFPHTRIEKKFEGGEILVLANGVMIEQILANVLDNACRYNDIDGRVKISACVSDGFASVVVTDTGPGVAIDDLPHLFERFFRGSRTTNIAGTGLGLAIAKGFVEVFGGSIEADSPCNFSTEGPTDGNEGGAPGTKITINLPLLDNYLVK